MINLKLRWFHVLCSAYLASSFLMNYNINNNACGTRRRNNMLSSSSLRKKLNGSVLQKQQPNIYQSSEIHDNIDTKSFHVLSIEYCTGCRWMLRSAWLMQELFTTFNDEIGSITLIPSKPPSPGGTFLIKLNHEVLWDRKIDNGFPEVKELKRRVRDKVAPTKNLGHSDSKIRSSKTDTDENITLRMDDKKNRIENECQECTEISKQQNITQSNNNESETDESGLGSVNNKGSPHVVIHYCTGCRWMLRSAWMCQELLGTFEQELQSISLVPNHINPGTFIITVDAKQIWDRKIDGGFPEIKVLKQRVRDEIAPSRNLGHSDINNGNENVNKTEQATAVEEMDDDDAADMRSYFGVL